MKLMMTVTLAIVVAMSAFMKPAVADDGDEFQRVEGQGYSGMGSDETAIKYRFELFNITTDGKPISDEKTDNQKIGLFKGAIRNYTRAKEQYARLPNIERSLNNSDYDSSGNPILRGRFVADKTIFDVGDLLAELIKDNSNLYVRYSIYDSYEAEKPPFSYFILNINNPAKAFPPLPNPINPNKAVNNLSYILDNNLLDGVFPNSSLQPKNFVPCDGSLCGGEKGSYLIKTATFKKNIPEPSATASLLVLGTLGGGSLLKRKTKQI